MAVLPMTLGDP